MYSMLAVPMIDGEIEKGQIEPERVKVKSNHRYEKLIGDIFPEDDWIHDDCKILDAKQSVLFFKEAKQLEDGNWEVKPFTMFLNPDSTLAESLDAEQAGVKKDKPIILRTDEGAYIRFEDGSAPNSPSGKFAGARMPGKVIVMREESEPGAKDSFEFKTTNIQVEKTQILAVNPVQFKYGPHYGSGHNLTINLADVDATKKKRKRHLPIVRNLKTVELAHLDSITLMPDDIDLTGSSNSSLLDETNEKTAQDTAQKKSALETSVAKSPVEIKCAGPFRLDFGKSQMVLFDEVHVEQMHNEGLHDHLYCDRLEVDFIIRKRNKQSKVEAKDKINFHRVTAFGSPARLLVDSKDAYAQADFIEYFIKRQIIHCRSNVELRDGSHQFIAPEIQYKLTKNNQLGTGWATGPGQITGNPEDPKKHFQATWQSEFNIQPHEGKKAISLHGNAHIIFQGDQHFGCDELHFWLWEKRQRGAKAKWDFFPAQLLGQRNVTMDAPEFAGKVNEIRVFWPKPIGTIPDDPKEKNRSTQTKQRGTGTNRLVSNAGRNANRDESEKDADEPVENRVVASGQVAIAYLTDKNELRSFRVEKDVHVKSIDLTPLLEGKPAKDLLEIRGNEIQVDSTTQKDAYKISVLGSPATIDAEGIRFISEQLHVDQSAEQKAWTNFPGKVIVSPEIKAEERPFGPQPETTIQWNKRFEFDGQVIVLSDDVRFEGFDYLESGDQVEYSGSTPILKARTNRRINFSESLKKTNAKLSQTANNNRSNQFNGNDINVQYSSASGFGSPRPAKSSKPKIKISEFAMLQNAYIKSITREAINEIKSIDEIQAREINLNTLTGDARALGPGNVRSIRKGEEKKPGQESEDLLSGISSNKSKISYMEIAFSGKITGNVKDRSATVHENVRCVYGPAETWETRYDPDSTTINGEEIYMNANQLTFNQWKPAGSKKALIEIGAIGNTEIEGKKVRATATQLTYTEENEMILLEGLQRDTAKIWFRKNESSQWQHGEAKQFRYQRKTGEYVGTDIKFMRALQLEAPQLKRR